MSMVASSVMDKILDQRNPDRSLDFELPDDCGYNKIYKYSWKTPTYGLPMHVSNKIASMVTGRWGWHFVPHENMDYNSDDWYENQTLVITFERKWDLVMCRLMISLKD